MKEMIRCRVKVEMRWGSRLERHRVLVVGWRITETRGSDTFWCENLLYVLCITSQGTSTLFRCMGWYFIHAFNHLSTC